MPNKEWNKLLETDKLIRRMFATQMWDNNETILTIEYFGGFELFNTRPYHNYENWSEGWRLKTGDRFGNITVIEEDLDDAIRKMQNALIEWWQSLTGKERKNYFLYWIDKEIEKRK